MKESPTSIETTPLKIGLIQGIRGNLRRSPRLLPDVFWTFTSHVVVALSGLLIVKVISKYVAAQEYGKASLVLGVIGLLTQFVAGPMITAHLRLYFEHSKRGMGELYAIAVRKLLLITAAIMSAIYFAFAIGNHAVSNSVYLSLALPAVFLLFVQTQLTGTFAFIEAAKRYRSLSLAYSLSRILQVPFLILLVSVSVAGPVSVVLSQALAAAAVVLIWRINSAAVVTGQGLRVDFSMQEIAASAVRAFGPTLYLYSFFAWIAATSDRYVINHFWSAKEVGIYAVNYGLWSIPYLTLSAWLEGLVRSRIFERAEAQDWAGVRRILRNRLILTFLLGSVLTAVIYFVGKRLALLLLGERYWYGETLMLLVSVAHWFYVMGMVFYTVFISAKRVAIMMYIAVAAGLLNVALNIFLVPYIGIAGAGWSTLLTYVVMSVLMISLGIGLLSKLLRLVPETENAKM